MFQTGLVSNVCLEESGECQPGKSGESRTTMDHGHKWGEQMCQDSRSVKKITVKMNHQEEGTSQKSQESIWNE